jgi:23S rRNA (cytidine2498-2'-O)-methyltransferase
MVEQPARIAILVAKWLANGWARYAIFNLKLPMKKRNEEVERCRQIIGEALEEAGRSYILQVKQLYHDREEVTGFVMLPSRKERFAHNVAARDKPNNTSRNAQKKSPPKSVAAGKTGPGTPVQSRPALNLSSKLPRAAASPWSVKPLPKRKKSK